MDSRFANLRQRDTSVSMLRVKLSRRRSQSQKENRERVVNTRRQLDKLQEMENSTLDASNSVSNMSTIQEKMHNKANSAKTKALEERLKQLERWKERKTLEKEKEKRERERKGVFKTGLYHPKGADLVALPPVPTASTRAKETKVSTAPSQSSRVTRSMKQQQLQKPLKTQNLNTAAKRAPPAMERSIRGRAASVKNNVCAVEPVVRASSTRSVNRPPLTAVPVVKDKPKDQSADVRTTRSRAIVNRVAPSTGRTKNSKAAATVNNTIVHPALPKETELKEPVEEPCPPSSTSSSEEEENMVVDHAPADSAAAVDPVEDTPALSSFAPKGFLFQAPVGLSSFKFEPLTPRSAGAFLTPSPSLGFPPVPLFNNESQAEPSGPPPRQSPCRSPPRLSPATATSNPSSPLESKHDVPYFRSEIASETDRLMVLCGQWEPKVEDESIPEEMRDRMRTAVGQARLLMKERFNQFNGLVDDCELCRGEKITTCSDLQGFWDMVYYQVEDVIKKFDALKEAESRGWVEEHKPPPRQRKVVKKPAAEPAKPAGTKAAAKSRLAAIKAAMKAKQQAAKAEEAAQAAGTAEDEPGLSSGDSQPQSEAQQTDTVVVDGGLFQVESPANASGSVRRSSRLSAAVLPQASPCSNYLSPRRVTRRSLALTQTQGSPAQPIPTPVQSRLAFNQTPGTAPKSQRGTPKACQRGEDAGNISLCFSPVKEVSSDSTQQIETVCTPIRAQLLPSISVVQEEDKPAEVVGVDLSLSPRLSLSPCKSLPPLCQAAEASSALSFTLSPSTTPCQPPFSPPTAICSPAVQSPMEALQSTSDTDDSSVLEEIPGLDFERYLQPTQRCSLSPKVTLAFDQLSPMAEDVEMESPRGQQEAAPPAVSSLLTPQSPQAQTAASSLLLFTPNPRDRIRQSRCPADLMVFTPPL